jgi:asparagine synthase (glutamine-hydrolysing)
VCGIAGCWHGSRGGVERAVTMTRAMASALAHRGPDSSGDWEDSDHALSLSHRRLAILDLSAEGHQPMVSSTGRYVLVFNGEVYNFRALRAELESRVSFRGHSDTEVVLAAIESWGIQAAVCRFVGMFAFAVWDRQRGELTLVRDRLGIKPLYYGWVGDTLVFGSELGAIRGLAGFPGVVDRDALTLLLRHNCIPAPYSIYRGISKLRPGTILRFSSPNDRTAMPEPYWSAADVVEKGRADPFSGTAEEATDALEALLAEAVKLRMIADVPLGAFLSGGIDSSLVVALMQSQSGRRVSTFSIGSTNPEYDEAGHAAMVARHLGTDHTELYLSDADALAVVPLLPRIFDEPFADASLLPTYLVAALARRHVTVSLSGDGGDELFGGYNRHIWGARAWRTMRPLPVSVRRGIGRMAMRVRPGTWDRLFAGAGPVLPPGLRHRMPGYKIHRLAALLDAESPGAVYHRLASHWLDPASVVLDGREPATLLTEPGRPDAGSFSERMMYLDLVTYLPDDILTKVDRASMAVSLEARVPLLDHRVVEFAWRLPLSVKIRDGRSKWILRQILDRHVPAELIDRPKTGFGIPLGHWLRGPLREWAESLLDEQRLAEHGFFRPAPIRQMWGEHLSGRYAWEYHLWDVLMFQAWLEAEEGRAAASSDPAGLQFKRSGAGGAL